MGNQIYEYSGVQSYTPPWLRLLEMPLFQSTGFPDFISIRYMKLSFNDKLKQFITSMEFQIKSY